MPVWADQIFSDKIATLFKEQRFASLLKLNDRKNSIRMPSGMAAMFQNRLSTGAQMTIWVWGSQLW